MPVAKSYQSFKIDGEPFTTNGRQYVKLSNGKTVRWYSDSEYQKLYPEAVKIEKPKRSLKDVLGFSEGFISIFKGDTYANLEWFQDTQETRYNKIWGWFVPSEVKMPQDVPLGLEVVRLEWSAIASDDNTLRLESVIKAAVDAVTCDPSPSQHIGKIGDRLDVEVKVVKAIQSDGYYGHSTFHIFEDANQNIYTWNTATKSLPVGNQYTIRGTVKNHETYKGAAQTALTRCSIIKEGAANG